jgi:predicted transcriptional regulator
MMAEDNTTARVDPHLVAQIVGSYVRHHKIAADEVAGLIAGVRRSLAEVGGQAPPEEDRVPAVPVRRSVQRDYVVCLECGFRGLTLRRHLTIRHGLDPAAYRARWKLAAGHPLVAPSYSERRSRLAQQLGLGRKAVAAEASPPVTENVSRRRGRPRRSQSTA